MKKMLCAVFCVLLLGGSAAVSGAAYEFRGLVINIAGDSIEIKKGNKEVTLYWAEGAKVTLGGKEAGRDAVAVCQRVTARYDAKDGRLEIVSLAITGESYCAK